MVCELKPASCMIKYSHRKLCPKHLFNNFHDSRSYIKGGVIISRKKIKISTRLDLRETANM